MGRVLAIFIVLVAVPAFAVAKPRVAILPIENDASGDMLTSVTDAIDGSELVLLGPKQVQRAMEKLNLDTDISDKQLKKLATELDADAVVRAVLSNKAPNKLLHFKLVVNGKKQRGFKVEFGSAKSERFKGALHEKIVDKITNPDEEKPKKRRSSDDDDDDRDRPSRRRRPDDDDDDRPSRRRRPDDDDDDRSPRKRRNSDDDDDRPSRRSSRTDDPGDDDSSRRSRGGRDDDDSVRAHVAPPEEVPTERMASRAAFRVEAGPSFTGRTLSFNTTIFSEGAGNPKTYSNAPVPGARIDAAVYPFSFANQMSGAAGLGFAVMYDKVLALGLHNALMPATTYNVDESRWSIGARYRILFGKKPTSPSLTLSLDYDDREFVVANRPAANTMVVLDIPDIVYTGVTGGASLRVPVASTVALFGNLGSMLTMSAGPIQELTSYGQAQITEFEFSAGIEVVVAKWMVLRADAEFSQFGFKFKGNGALANDRDGDMTSIDVGGATDRYIGGAVTIGVLY